MVNPTDWQIAYAASLIRGGRVIAYPTESVWGLGCDPENPVAVERLLEIKGRPVSKGLILVSGYSAHFKALLRHLSVEQQESFMQTTDRPTTWLLPDPEQVIPEWIKGEHNAVAVRLSRHPAVMALSSKFGGALVSTSANPAGKPTATDKLSLRRYFGHGARGVLNYILPGSVDPNAKPSTIKNILTGEIIRQ